MISSSDYKDMQYKTFINLRHVFHAAPFSRAKVIAFIILIERTLDLFPLINQHLFSPIPA